MTRFAHVTIESDEQHLHTRIRAEFNEMPGLTLTLAQASRLFNVDPPRCERLLRALVEAGAISTNGPAFVRSDVGRRCA